MDTDTPPQLGTALGLSESDELVSFVGAGGKKTAMSRLVTEALGRSLRVGYTTTAHMPPPSSLPLFVGERGDLQEWLNDSKPAVAFARAWIDDPDRVDEKVAGFEPPVIDEIYRTERFDWLLVKADGARMRELKAPDQDEPPVPSESTRVVPTASVRAVGTPLPSDIAHRPQRVMEITGLGPGDRITPEAIGTLLAHPEGGCKNVPETASLVPLVNKADTDEQRATARRAIETALSRSDRIERGIIASLRDGWLETIE